MPPPDPSHPPSLPEFPPLPPPHTRVGVGGVLIRQGRVLVNKAVYRPRFTLPGGFVDPGETLDAALRREFEEETGVTVRLGPLLLTRHEVTDPTESGVYFAFRVEWVAGDPRPRPPEIEESREVPLAEALAAPWISELSRLAIRIGADGPGAWARSGVALGKLPVAAMEIFHPSRE